MIAGDFDLPSLHSKDSTVKDLMYGAGEDISEDIDDEAGDNGGEREHSLEESEQDLKLRSSGDSSYL